VTDLTALSISYEALQERYRSSTTWERFGRLVDEAYLLALVERTLSLQFMSARGQCEELLQRQQPVEQHVPLNQMAACLDIAQETLSRLRGRWGHSSLIRELGPTGSLQCAQPPCKQSRDAPLTPRINTPAAEPA
jgi:hypothetical protein